MKQIIFPLILIFLVTCQRDEALPEATSAAKEVYLQYADRKDLTVALIGDYQGYNAVMLQAQTTEDWLQLCDEFGVRGHVDAEALDTSRVSGLTIANFNTGTYNSLEDFEPHSDSVIREAVSHISNSTIREAVTHIFDSLTGQSPTPNSRPISIRIDTCYSVSKRLHYEHGVLVDSAGISDTAIPAWNKQLMNTTVDNGHSGYIIHNDSDALTLWLFFYTTPTEKEQILNHVTSINTQQ